MDLGTGMRATFNLLAAPTRLRGSRDLMLPSSWALVVNAPSLPYIAHLEVEVEAGNPVCRSLTCEQRRGGKPVETAALRSIPVDRLVTDSILALGLLLRAEPGANGTTILRPALMTEVTEAAVRRARRARLTPDHLRSVADVYQTGGSAPTEAVRAHFHVKPSTASRWVSEARRLGFLAPPKQIRADQTEGSEA